MEAGGKGAMRQEGGAPTGRVGRGGWRPGPTKRTAAVKKPTEEEKP